MIYQGSFLRNPKSRSHLEHMGCSGLGGLGRAITCSQAITGWHNQVLTDFEAVSRAEQHEKGGGEREGGKKEKEGGKKGKEGGRGRRVGGGEGGMLVSAVLRERGRLDSSHNARG